MNIFNNAGVTKIPTPQISSNINDLANELLKQKNATAKVAPPPPYRPNAPTVKPIVPPAPPTLGKAPSSLSVLPPLRSTPEAPKPIPATTPAPKPIPATTPTPPAPVSPIKSTPEPAPIFPSSPASEEGTNWFGYLFIIIGLAIIGYLVYRIGKLIYDKYKDKLRLSEIENEMKSLIDSSKKAIEEEEEQKTIVPPKQQQAPLPKVITEEEEQSPHAEKCSTKQEVFNISNNVFRYDDAKAVCQAVGARLATLDEVKEAYRNGADWCNYGWTEGQIAVYPTQKETWEKLQKGPEKHRKDCGVVGINGGYFDNKNLRFGVNCYGIKRIPTENEKNMNYFNPDYTTKEERETEEKIEKYKMQLKDINIMPFNKLDWIQGGSSDKYCKINK